VHQMYWAELRYGSLFDGDYFSRVHYSEFRFHGIEQIRNLEEPNCSPNKVAWDL
jgi:hypothetical protein